MFCTSTCSAGPLAWHHLWKTPMNFCFYLRLSVIHLPSPPLSLYNLSVSPKRLSYYIAYHLKSIHWFTHNFTSFPVDVHTLLAMLVHICSMFARVIVLYILRRRIACAFPLCQICLEYFLSDFFTSIVSALLKIADVEIKFAKFVKNSIDVFLLCQSVKFYENLLPMSSVNIQFL